MRDEAKRWLRQAEETVEWAEVILRFVRQHLL